MKRFLLGFFFLAIIASSVFIIAVPQKAFAWSGALPDCTNRPPSNWQDLIKSVNPNYNYATDQTIIFETGSSVNPAPDGKMYFFTQSDPFVVHAGWPPSGILHDPNNAIYSSAAGTYGLLLYGGQSAYSSITTYDETTHAFADMGVGSNWSQPYATCISLAKNTNYSTTTNGSTFTPTPSDGTLYVYTPDFSTKTDLQVPVYVHGSSTGAVSLGIDLVRLRSEAPAFIGTIDANNTDSSHIIITNSAGKTLTRSAIFDPATQFYVEGQPTMADGTTYDLNTQYIDNYDASVAPLDFGIDLIKTLVILPQDTYTATFKARVQALSGDYNLNDTQIAFKVGKDFNLSWIGDHWCYSANGQDCQATQPTGTASTVYDGSGTQATVTCDPWDITCVVGVFFDGVGQVITDLIVPDWGFMGTSLSHLNTVFQDKLGFIYYPFTFIGTFLNGVFIASSAPSCTVDFGNLYGLDMNYNFCVFQDKLPTFFSWAQYALIGTTSFSLMFALNTKLQGVLRS